MLLGCGEALWEGLDAAALGYVCDQAVMGERAMHVMLKRAG